MKILLIFILIIHGLIHLMGFMKAFGFSGFSQLTEDISKPIGVLWLASALLFLTSAIFLIANKEWWWMPAILATVTSQILIFLTWQDAKFGTIANIIILLAAIIAVAVWNFNVKTQKEINLLLSERESQDESIITEQMLDPVPSQVQTWLRNVGVVGKENIHTVYLKQKGIMKLKPDQKKWSKAEAEQYITTEQPAFLWKVDMGMLPLVNVSGRDLFKEGKGHMIMKVASLIPVAKVEDNNKVNESSLQRYLLELPWYPTAALSSYITWETIDEYTVKASMTYQGVSGSANFHFNQDGQLEQISAFRYKDSNSDERIECIGEIKGSKVIDGIKLPTKINITWMLEEGGFTWYKLEIYDVEFN